MASSTSSTSYVLHGTPVRSRRVAQGTADTDRAVNTLNRPPCDLAASMPAEPETMNPQAPAALPQPGYHTAS